jgi:hypothetical protein
MRRLQKSELSFNAQQEKNKGKIADEKILLQMPQAHFAQGGEVEIGCILEMDAGIVKWYNGGLQNHSREFDSLCPCEKSLLPSVKDAII